MYDYDLELPFELGLNLETIAFVLNIGIPVLYFANFIFLSLKLKGMDKNAPFYSFIKSLVYFFFFYGLGAVFFVWYDFFYMDFISPNPIFAWWGEIEAPPIEVVNLWKIGILLTAVGLLFMVNQLRHRIFQKKFYKILPIIWEAIGIPLIILIGFVPIPILGEHPYFYAEILFLFVFTWSISLPLTYSYIWKNAAGKMKRYALILFVCFIAYGIAWGFRTRFAVWMGTAIMSLTPPPFDILSTYPMIWTIRAALIVLNLALVLYAYKKLLETF
ncbi:MAG: hypothetical protein EU544_03405 [Promethearchaeota archaeon]|nr:MAG: hypothetical protein EU544_03405 [Candidatus Lokiarchaeota archaeon]